LNENKIEVRCNAKKTDICNRGVTKEGLKINSKREQIIRQAY